MFESRIEVDFIQTAGRVELIGPSVTLQDLAGSR